MTHVASRSGSGPGLSAVVCQEYAPVRAIAADVYGWSSDSPRISARRVRCDKLSKPGTITWPSGEADSMSRSVSKRALFSDSGPAIQAGEHRTWYLSAKACPSGGSIMKRSTRQPGKSSSVFGRNASVPHFGHCFVFSMNRTERPGSSQEQRALHRMYQQCASGSCFLITSCRLLASIFCWPCRFRKGSVPVPRLRHRTRPECRRASQRSVGRSRSMGQALDGYPYAR